MYSSKCVIIPYWIFELDPDCQKLWTRDQKSVRKITVQYVSQLHLFKSYNWCTDLNTLFLLLQKMTTWPEPCSYPLVMQRNRTVHCSVRIPKFLSNVHVYSIFCTYCMDTEYLLDCYCQNQSTHDMALSELCQEKKSFCRNDTLVNC